MIGTEGRSDRLRIGPVELIWDREKRSLYLFRVFLTPTTRWGRAHLHVFFRGDDDDHPHDHPWDFWTFPLTPYAELVLEDGVERENVVEAWRAHRRPAEYAHRVVDRLLPDGVGGYRFPERLWSRRIVTLVWVCPKRRDWGFIIPTDHPKATQAGAVVRLDSPLRAARSRLRAWVHWRDYLDVRRDAA